MPPKSKRTNKPIQSKSTQSTQPTQSKSTQSTQSTQPEPDVVFDDELDEDFIDTIPKNKLEQTFNSFDQPESAGIAPDLDLEEIENLRKQMQTMSGPELMKLARNMQQYGDLANNQFDFNSVTGGHRTHAQNKLRAKLQQQQNARQKKGVIIKKQERAQAKRTALIPKEESVETVDSTNTNTNTNNPEQAEPVDQIEQLDHIEQIEQIEQIDPVEPIDTIVTDSDTPVVKPRITTKKPNRKAIRAAARKEKKQTTGQ